jgi:putative membrane protein insertion efficiency factor
VRPGHHINADIPMRPSLPARFCLGLITLYRYTLSPFIGGHCRYLPTCSHYAGDAVRAHGAWAGSWMALARLCRCRPGGANGYDPAPAAKPRAHWWAPWEYGDWRGPAAQDQKRHHSHAA